MLTSITDTVSNTTTIFVQCEYYRILYSTDHRGRSRNFKRGGGGGGGTHCTPHDSLPIALLPPVVRPALLTVPEGDDALVFCNNNNVRQLIPSAGGVQWWDPNGNPAPAGGPAQFSSKKKGGGGVQPLTREQFVLQINKI